MPVFTTDGFPMGTICVIDFEPSHLNEKQKEGLRTIAKQVAKLIQLSKSSRDEILERRQRTNSRQKFLAIQEMAMGKIAQLLQEKDENNDPLIAEMVSDMNKVVAIERHGVEKQFLTANLQDPSYPRYQATDFSVQMELPEEFPASLDLDWRQLQEILELVAGLCQNLGCSDLKFRVDEAWHLQTVVKYHFEFILSDISASVFKKERHQLRIFLINSILSYFSDELSIEEADDELALGFEMQMSLR